MGYLTSHAVDLKEEFQNHPVAQAVLRLLNAANQHQGGSTIPINHFLLSLYDGATWAPDMQLLCRRIDGPLFDDVITVLRGHSANGVELHNYFVSGGKLFEDIAQQVPMRLAGEYCSEGS